MALVDAAPVVAVAVQDQVESPVPPMAHAAILASATIALPLPVSAPPAQRLALIVPPPPPPVTKPIHAVVPAPVPVTAIARIVPAPMVASAAPAAEPAPFDPPQIAPVEVADARPAAVNSGPRLERLTLGEVALVTSPARRPAPPRPAPAPLAAPPAILARAAAPVRFSSLAPPLADQQSLRTDGRERVLLVLNAARVQGLAARTRRYLAGHGVRQALVGDAPRVRDRSVIIAPPSQWARAKALARSLKFAPRTIRGSRLMLVLGRDSVDAARG